MVFEEPILAFVKAFRLKGDASALKHAALGRFSISLLCDAKKRLWEHCADDLAALELPFTPRRSSEKRSQAVADLDDILLAFDKLDDVDKIPEIFCEASELVKLPPIATDPIGELITSNASSLNVIEDKISQLQVEVNTLSSKVDLSGTPCPTSYAGVLKSVPVPRPPPVLSSASSAASSDTQIHNRSENLIIFGLPEAKSLLGLRESVDQLLEFVVGDRVPFKDLFRLGRRPQANESESSSTPRPRPILLKLSSTWDRRLIMSNVGKLKEYTIKRLFIREDLPPEARQRRKESAKPHDEDTTTGNKSLAPVPSTSHAQSRVPSSDSSSVSNTNS